MDYQFENKKNLNGVFDINESILVFPCLIMLKYWGKNFNQFIFFKFK